ncbi:hypothetical protein [Mucisphaera calidilacus]|uniref:PEP-CTERM protein-sorting domain-containing protein n=1 Tax=Mucisphaera calidilacus TaxID=2527982 RepID=A0A518BWI9_9BACT|nr:hypothetical protein [Mucisphaera calidilacus]QDU71340.1 hypothetical protein Pan265_11890 [Mucisphaera calidilacus]
MLKTTAAALAVVCCLTSAQAVIMHPDVDLGSVEDTPNLPGYTTATYYITGELLGFNAATIILDGTNYPGEFNQVEMFGQKGLFADDGLFAFVPTAAAEDTYFLFDRPALLVDGSFGESATGIEASFAYADPVTTDFDVIQIVLSDINTFPAPWMTIELAYPGGTEIITAFDAPLWVPTPASGALLGVAGLAFLRRR